MLISHLPRKKWRIKNKKQLFKNYLISQITYHTEGNEEDNNALNRFFVFRLWSDKVKLWRSDKVKLKQQSETDKVKLKQQSETAKKRQSEIALSSFI